MDTKTGGACVWAFEESPGEPNLGRIVRVVDGERVDWVASIRFNGSIMPAVQAQIGKDFADSHVGTGSVVDGAKLIAIERRRQIEKWSSAHDDEHVNGELRDAGVAYAMVCDDRAGDSAPGVWPFEPATFKPHETDNIENLVRAGAFIAAEIDRFLRRRDRMVEGALNAVAAFTVEPKPESLTCYVCGKPIGPNDKSVRENGKPAHEDCVPF